ncbi:SHOCT domain-containing protein [Salirhabdus salicampi]|uniref:SHOCT domain-containing protein n=1 Tax=Salirhabdus salicampi TaxID=476102 RepID=UPI0020C3A18D|nr:SHOCT domain-containing protein [Salirhabdus salicampi]MCP8616349.1 SHOCT domain-containing protein [Salirhabdus salicampi]
MMSMMSGGMMLNMIICMLILGFFIYGIVLLILKAFERKQEDSSIKILRERFARGEIDEQEFAEKKSKLEK